MSKISGLLDLAGGNLARPTMFSVNLVPPPELSGHFPQSYTDILCKTIKIPETTMVPIELKFKGHNLQIPGRTNQAQSIEMTFYLDERHQLRDLMAAWISGMDDRYYAVSDGVSASISESRNWFGSVNISAMDFTESNVTQSYIVEGIFPTSVEGPDYDSTAIGNITEFTVTFALYRFMNDTSNKYDNHDLGLDTLGRGPTTSGDNLGIGDLESILNRASNAWSTVNSSIDTIKELGSR